MWSFFDAEGRSVEGANWHKKHHQGACYYVFDSRRLKCWLVHWSWQSVCWFFSMWHALEPVTLILCIIGQLLCQHTHARPVPQFTPPPSACHPPFFIHWEIPYKDRVAGPCSLMSPPHLTRTRSPHSYPLIPLIPPHPCILTPHCSLIPLGFCHHHSL